MTIPTAYYSTIRRDPFIVSYYRLNETSGSRVYDWAAKYNLNGIYNGTPSANIPLIYQTATEGGTSEPGSNLFGETGRNIEVPDASPLRIIGDIAIEMWISAESANQTAALIGKMNTAYTFAEPYYLGLSAGKVYFALGNGTNQTILSSPAEIPAGIPYHIVATSFRKAMALYVNGIQVATKFLESQEVKDGEKPVYIGALGNNTNMFTGLIGEVAIYNTGFSAKKALRHYDIGRQVLNVENSPYITTFDPPTFSE
jgi:Concanavalin A-like lectin/glucanases superfamily